MVQVFIVKKAYEELLEVENIIIFEELSTEKEEYNRVAIKTEERSFKKALLKLLKKAKNNAKHLEEHIPIEKVRRNIYYRNTGLY